MNARTHWLDFRAAMRDRDGELVSFIVEVRVPKRFVGGCLPDHEHGAQDDCARCAQRRAARDLRLLEVAKETVEAERLRLGFVEVLSVEGPVSTHA